MRPIYSVKNDLLTKYVYLDTLDLSNRFNRSNKLSTKERFKNLIWNTLIELYDAPSTIDDAWITVGEVSRVTGVSKVTSRKYLEELLQEGNAARAIVGTAIGYRPTWRG